LTCFVGGTRPTISLLSTAQKKCLDVGTGAGVPGLILALANPEQHWVLLDSNSKKIRFVTQAVIELEVNNVEVVRNRVEDYQSDTPFTSITARAFASLAQLYKSTRHLLTKEGVLLAMKGPELAENIAQLDQNELDVQIHVLNVPGIDSGRSLVELRYPG
jgi:16S rRNA (guanine527-N7)-methyltransferase